MYILGLKFRELYVTNENLLSEIFDHREIFVQSTDKNRYKIKEIQKKKYFQKGP
jgi:hypothetical protein